MRKRKRLSPAQRRELEEQAASLRACVGSCFICNGTQLLCGRCGDAHTACRCGGAEEGDLMECPDCAPPEFKLAVDVVEKAIKIKAKRWPSNCFAISTAIVDAGLVPRGELRYGAYLGPIHSECPLRGGPIARHGWIEVPDGDREGSGYVVDATRWVFEHKVPYIAVIGANSREFEQYDVGAARTEAVLHQRPAEPPDETTFTGIWAEVVRVRWPKETHDLLQKHFGRASGLKYKQVHWLAHQPPAVLGSLARPVYATIRKAGHAGLIPIDYQQLVFKDQY